MKKIALNAHRLSFVIITFLLIESVYSFINLQNTWNTLSLMLVSVSWLSFFLLMWIQPEHKEK